MKLAVIVAAGAALAFAPLAAPAAPVQPEHCSSACCHDEGAQCQTNCPCPTLCLPQTTAAALIPQAEILLPGADRFVPAPQPADEEAALRTSRPPVPPPRA